MAKMSENMEPQMSYDDVAWEQSDDVSDNWLLQFLDIDVKRPIAKFILKHDSGDDPEFTILRKGSFNITLQMKYTYSATNIRFSQPGAILFPEEKVRNEVAVMRYISDHTPIPVPFVLHSGTREESPLNLSPFIMMSHIEHTTTMYDALNTPGCPNEERGVLDPNIDEDQLGMLYTQLAKTLLQLSKPEFPKIGSLSQVDDFSWEVSSRPLSMNMNELVRLGTLPRSKLPPLEAPFRTASSYIEALAQLNIQHLLYQRNDAVQSADDCRRRFIARQLFYKLARDKKLSLPCCENGPFKLWCDDFRPANILLNENMHIAGVVDWEFTYSGPVEFSYAPPWWLLIEKPEYWSGGIEDWAREFDRRLKTFLTAMRRCENMDTQHSQRRLSDQMQRSWESGDFWVVYAILHSFAFDAIYWQKIDRRFFGPTETDNPSEAWKERLNLLDESQKAEMERLVMRKLDEMEDRVLAWDPDEYTEAFRQGLMKRREEKAKDDKEFHRKLVEGPHE
jgi:aminoglycoside phosphotransferase (APT) family kinase protein